MMRVSPLLAGLALVFGTACGASYPVPEILDESGVVALARPQGAEKAVLLNFWATW